MKNAEIAKLLYEIADLLEIMNVAWNPVALRKAARSIETSSKDMEVIYKEKGLAGLQELSGVGEGIAKKIEEYLKTGRMKDVDELKKKIPAGVEDLLKIPAIGPKKAWRLYKELEISDINKLKDAAKSGKIRKLDGFGEKSEQDILIGIEMLKKHGERKLLWETLPLARHIVERIKRLKEVDRVEIAGSLRRRKETIGDIDILVTSSKPAKVMDFFTSMDEVARVNAKGETRSAVVLRNGMNCDIRVIDDKSYGAALMYFTGNKDVNVVMRQMAIKKGWKLSEYGLFDKNEKIIAGRTEEEIFHRLGLPYLEPEMRENTGELDEFSMSKKPPELIGYDDVKGDLHVHTVWSDGHYSTEVMIKEAIKMEYKYMAITDHSKSSTIANGLDEKRMLKHMDEIENIARKHDEIDVLKGAEVDILKDGSLDYNDSLLSKLDFVIASVHSNFKMNEREMTSRIIKAIENKHTNAIGHLTGRLINSRQAYEVDVDKILQAARENNVAMEINSFPTRLDLRDIHIKMAVKNNVRLVINTDSHDTSHFKFIEYGISQARRGWATRQDVVNSWPLQRFKKFLAK